MEAELERLKKENEILNGNIEDLLEEIKNIKVENIYKEEDINNLCAIIKELRQEKEILKQLNQNKVVFHYPFEDSKDEDFDPLKDHPKYKISIKYNYPIRIKKNKICIKRILR